LIRRYKDSKRQPLINITNENKNEYLFPDQLKFLTHDNESEEIMKIGKNNSYIIWFMAETLPYCTYGKNKRFSLDGTLWSEMAPVYNQLLVVLLTIEVAVKKFIQLPVSFIVMTSRTSEDYNEVLKALNELVYKYTGNYMGTDLITTDSERALINTVKEVFDTNKTELLNCGFHTNQNVRRQFHETLKAEVTINGPNFNQKVFDIYAVQLKLYFLPSEFVIKLNNYLIKKVLIGSFDADNDENIKIKNALRKNIEYSINRYEKEGERISWNNHIMRNRDLKFVDSTSCKLERLNSTIRARLRQYSHKRTIDVISTLRKIFILEQIQGLSNIKHKSGYSINKKKSIEKYDKLLTILDGLRLRSTKIEDSFLEKLYTNILSFYNV